MITLVFSMRFNEEEDGEIVAENVHSRVNMGDWIDCDENAEAGVGDAIRDFWDSQEHRWNEVVGVGMDYCEFLVEVNEPPGIAGNYEVTVEKKFRARAERVR